MLVIKIFLITKNCKKCKGKNKLGSNETTKKRQTIVLLFKMWDLSKKTENSDHICLDLRHSKIDHATVKRNLNFPTIEL